MLRKITHIILSVFLLVTTVGVTFSMHYCSGNYVSTSINKETKSCCDSTTGCCENKTVQIEVENDYVSPIQIDNKIVELDFFLSFIFASNFELSLDFDEIYELYTGISPPFKIQTRLSLLQTYLC
ncbi:MAG: hypothetical protein RBR35_10685 [Salinivirgaceae bacterium]|nr:hypothetical protein [Salinivirgaceae bacterium]MDY0281013.1 hypothetical protein [Salinivirgaceae bacterium]